MLLALIDPMIELEETETNKNGDVVVVTHYEFIFGNKEVKELQVVEWVDDTLETQIEELIESGERGLIVYPYRELEENDEGQIEILQRSIKGVELNTHPQWESVLDVDVKVDNIAWNLVEPLIINRDSLLGGE